jgi:hypothetical protein
MEFIMRKLTLKSALLMAGLALTTAIAMPATAGSAQAGSLVLTGGNGHFGFGHHRGFGFNLGHFHNRGFGFKFGHNNFDNCGFYRFKYFQTGRTYWLRRYNFCIGR